MLTKEQALQAARDLLEYQQANGQVRDIYHDTERNKVYGKVYSIQEFPEQEISSKTVDVVIANLQDNIQKNEELKTIIATEEAKMEKVKPVSAEEVAL